MPAGLSHALFPYFLPLYARSRKKEALSLKTKVIPFKEKKNSSSGTSFFIPSWEERRWKDLFFPNPLGLAAGVDKNGTQCSHWWKLGAGFLELGTVTPRAQRSHLGKTIDRNLRHQSLWNHLGFPSVGVEVFKKRLQKLPSKRPPLFINIGKNRETRLEDASEDYTFLAEELSSYADAFVINISSPNSPQLCQMQKPSYLVPLLKALQKKTASPFLLKLSPDFNSSDDFLEVLKIGVSEGVCGFVLTNTTVCPLFFGARETETKMKIEDREFFQKKHGGYSGKALQSLSCRRLEEAVNFLNGGSHGIHRKDFLLVSVGGILSPQDVKQRLFLGADLVEVYSALVFHGPGFFLDTASYFGK